MEFVSRYSIGKVTQGSFLLTNVINIVILITDICQKGGLMPRPVRCRRIERLPVYRSFSPDDITAAENVKMTVDEFEALRLLDDEGLTQEACAARMNIARTTVTAIYESARKKVADALVHGKRLLITGGCCEFKPVEIQTTRLAGSWRTEPSGFTNGNFTAATGRYPPGRAAPDPAVTKCRR